MSGPQSTDKDFRELIRLAEGKGWRIDRSGGGHLRWCGPSGGIVFTAYSPSDRRALANVRSYLRKAGLDL